MCKEVISFRRWRFHLSDRRKGNGVLDFLLQREDGRRRWNWITMHIAGGDLSS